MALFCCEPPAVADGHFWERWPEGRPKRHALRPVWRIGQLASGELLEKLVPSRRAYRWLFRALPTLIIALCAASFVFSLTAVALAWRGLRLSFGFSGNREGGQHTDAG